MRTRALAIGLFCTGIALAGCSGGSGDKGGEKPAGSKTTTGNNSSAPAESEIPSGYRKIGGSENGFTAGVPKNWKPLNVTSGPQARAYFRKAGVSSAVAEQTIKTLQQNHAVFVFDPESGRTRGFATNVNGFCLEGAAPSADQVKAQFETIGAQKIKTRDVTVGGQAGQKTTYELGTGGSQQVAAQYAVPGASGKTCFVTITAKKGVKAPFNTIGETIRAL
jgi:hypothetical protein